MGLNMTATDEQPARVSCYAGGGSGVVGSRRGGSCVSVLQAAREESPEPPVVFEPVPLFVSADLESVDFESEDFVSGFESPELSAESGFPVSLLFPLSRKSVTYQPSPLRWNAAALISFLSLGLPQDGHLRLGRSLNFWRNS